MRKRLLLTLSLVILTVCGVVLWWRGWFDTQPRLLLTLSLVILTVCGVVLWWRGWFDTQPVYHGRTVTAWLDKMALFDAERNGEQGFSLTSSPAIVTNDAALHALAVIGP